MLMYKDKGPAAVPGGILQLAADLSDRFALPCHFDRSQAPTRIPGNALVRGSLMEDEIMIGMAGLTGSDISIRGRRMHVPVVSLGGAVARGVAVHAPGTSDYLGGFGE